MLLQRGMAENTPVSSEPARSNQMTLPTLRVPMTLFTSTSRAAVLTFTMPMMAALIAWFWLGERPGRRGGLALALGAAGVAVLAALAVACLLRPDPALALEPCPHHLRRVCPQLLEVDRPGQPHERRRP